MISPAIDAVKVDDVWECFRHAHKGQRIRVTKVSDRSVEFHLERSRGAVQREGRGISRNHLLKDVLVRDFVLVHSMERSSAPMISPTIDDVQSAATAVAAVGKTCTQCGRFLDIELFDHFTGKARDRQPEGRINICHPCVVRKRGDGIRRASAARAEAKANGIAEPPPLPPDPDPEPEPEPTPVQHTYTYEPLPERQNGYTVSAVITNPPPRPNGSIAMALLDLAAQADALEHPPAYRELLTAAQSVLNVGTKAVGVYVLDQITMDVLAEAVEAAEQDLEKEGA